MTDHEAMHRDSSLLLNVPLRRLIVARRDWRRALRGDRPLDPVEVVRPNDLVHLTFSFHNLRLESDRGGPPRLVRRTRRRPAYLVVEFQPQHITEVATFETAEGYPVKNPRPHVVDPDVVDPDVGAVGKPPRPPPIFASIAGSSRLILEVTDEEIPYTLQGLLSAIGRLDLSVAPQAVPPAPRRLIVFADVFDSEMADMITVFRAANAPLRDAIGGRLVATAGPTRVAAELAALGRARASGAALEYRFGTESAADALQASTLGSRLGIVDIIDVTSIVPVDPRPPTPAPPAATHTTIELPWRLIVSPNRHGAFAHSAQAVEHNGRYELWHTRLGIRAVDKGGQPILDKDGHPTVDERDPNPRTIRAIWARDFELLDPPFGFTSVDFPEADRSEDIPATRMSLNSRDRMMLVHQTANFHLRRQGSEWVPEAVPTNRLMLTTLGGWLDSRVQFPTLPDGGFTIEEWKHRAAMGRDHEVKVVYAGFLLPFGHKASLVKVTERKMAEGPAGTIAYLFQRMFIVVRQPEKRFRTDTRALDDGRRLDNVMPLGTVRILTRTTPLLDDPHNLVPGAGASGYFFEPRVAGSRFEFKMVATDLEDNIVEFSAPLVFMERDHNDPDTSDLDTTFLDIAIDAYNNHTLVQRQMNLRGQRVAFAESQQIDDTTLATHSLEFQVATASFLGDRPQDEPRFAPVLHEAEAVVPAMSVIAGADQPTRLAYPEQYAAGGFVDNAAEVFLATLDSPALNFAGQGDRSGGFATPSLDVKGLSRITGPIGGDIEKAMGDAANFDMGDFFSTSNAKLFGLIPLGDLFGTLGLTPDRVPSFVTQALDVATTLKQNVERLRNVADAEAAALGAAAAQLKADIDALLADLAALASDPSNPPDLETDLTDIVGHLEPFIAEAQAAASLAEAQRRQLVGVARRVQDQLDEVGDVVGLLIDFANGLKVPEVINARLEWSTEIDPWDPGSGVIFEPLDPQTHQPAPGRITLAVEVQAPTTPGKQPSALIACSLSPFDLRLIGDATFVILHFETMEFSTAPGKKPDVNVQFREPGGIEFAGPLEFVNTLKDIIPFDGFSDPPYLDVSAEGIKAGFDLPIPDVAVGVFALSNISLGAHFIVPFIDESIEVAFNFATRDNPFRLQVSLFAGGGFFGITITPDRVRVLEASFEFGAAISVSLGVASGAVSIMAGIYFRLETDATGERAQLTGYFRMRGEVDVLGLISACIELYLDLTYETSTGKAVGRATISVEIEVLFLSFSVSISCEKKFAGSNGDPTFVEVMGVPALVSSGTPRPWDAYCRAFADD